MGRRRNRTPPRSSIPTELTPRVEWDHRDPEPVATQPMLGTDIQPTADTAVSPEDAAAIIARIPACAHCGGRHVRACPRVKSMRFHPNGSLAGVDFWGDGKWSEAHVLFGDEMVAKT